MSDTTDDDLEQIIPIESRRLDGGALKSVLAEAGSKALLIKEMTDAPTHTRMCYATPIKMPANGNDFELNLHGPATVLQVLFVPRPVAGGLRRPDGTMPMEITPLVVFDCDTTRDLWRHAFTFAPANVPFTSVHPLVSRGAYVMPRGDSEMVVGLYEKILTPDQRVPQAEALAIKAYGDTTPDWSSLPRGHKAELIKTAELFEVPRMRELARVVWGGEQTVST